MIKAVIFDWGGVCAPGLINNNLASLLSKKLGINKKKIAAAYEIGNHDYLLDKIDSKTFWGLFSKKLGILST